jgi:hypothetical protein
MDVPPFSAIRKKLSCIYYGLALLLSSVGISFALKEQEIYLYWNHSMILETNLS